MDQVLQRENPTQGGTEFPRPSAEMALALVQSARLLPSVDASGDDRTRERRDRGHYPTARSRDRPGGCWRAGRTIGPKNALALVPIRIVRLTRQTASASYTTAVEGRIKGHSRAHTQSCRQSAVGKEADLGGLLRRVAPYEHRRGQNRYARAPSCSSQRRRKRSRLRSTSSAPTRRKNMVAPVLDIGQGQAELGIAARAISCCIGVKAADRTRNSPPLPALAPDYYCQQSTPARVSQEQYI